MQNEQGEEVRESFDFEQLKKVWDEFALKIKSEGRDADFNALKGELELVESEHIQLTIANKFQQVAIENLKQDLLDHLRTNLRNNLIKLDVEIKKIEEKELRYTSREKFEYLAKKYPKLRDLQSRFDLDPDF